MFTKTRPVLTIVVANGRWDAYGADTPAHKNLLKALKSVGGVADSVPDGTYQFTLLQHGIARAELSLTPVV